MEQRRRKWAGILSLVLPEFLRCLYGNRAGQRAMTHSNPAHCLRWLYAICYVWGYAARLTAILSAISVSAILRSHRCVRSANASLSARQVSNSAATP